MRFELKTGNPNDIVGNDEAVVAMSRSFSLWATLFSWTYCSSCGTSITNQKVLRQPKNVTLTIECKPCQPRPQDAEETGAKLNGQLMMYTSLLQSVGPRDHRIQEGCVPYCLQVLTDGQKKEAGIIGPLRGFPRNIRGGRAPVQSKLKKKAPIRAEWRKQCVGEGIGSDGQLRTAVRWLTDHNATHRAFRRDHEEFLRTKALTDPFWIPTSTLLLHMPGVEVAARPHLYPHRAMADSDLSIRAADRLHLSDATKGSSQHQAVMEIEGDVKMQGLQRRLPVAMSYL